MTAHEPSRYRQPIRASLHEHLDGSLLPQTLLELAYKSKVLLPETTVDGIRTHMKYAAAGSLATYLSSFQLTLAVLQTEEALERVAYEHACQLSADNCDRAEIRFAPQLHAPGLRNSIQAVLAGLERARLDGHCNTTLIICAMRESPPDAVLQVAHAASVERDCVGFDLAGMESNNPPQVHARALALVREAGLGITIHAGESEGAASIATALDVGATRIGHGVRIVDDITFGQRGPILGAVASRVLDQQTHLEVCVSSNLDTGIFPSVASHPVLTLHRMGFSVSLSTDNRLMSATTLVQEEQLCVEHASATVRDLATMRDAAKAHLFSRRS